jgi:hypothetical protein
MKKNEKLNQSASRRTFFCVLCGFLISHTTRTQYDNEHALDVAVGDSIDPSQPRNSAQMDYSAS